MVVRRDFNLASGQLLHWMVPTMMAKLQLEGLATECDTGELMTQTDSENRLPSHQSADRIDRIRTRLGIARPVREEHSVRLEREDIFRPGFSRNHRHPASFTT